MTAPSIKAAAQAPAAQNYLLKYQVDTTFVTGKGPTNLVSHTAEDATLKALCDYVLFTYQYDSAHVSATISGSTYSLPLYTAPHILGASSITDTPLLRKATIADTLHLASVALALYADSPLVAGIAGVVEKVTPPSATAPLSVSWPGNVWSLGTVGVASGGTGLTAFSRGDVLYAPATGMLGRLAASSPGYVLTMGGTLPQWQALPAFVSSVTNTDGSLVIAPAAGAVVASLNPAHANTWVAAQAFGAAPLFLTATASGGIHYSNSAGALMQTASGTAATVLHGGTSPAYSTVSLATDVSGILQAAQFPALSGDISTTPGSLATTLKNTGTAGTYGSAAQVPMLTTDAQGRVTGVVNTPISIPAAAVTGLAAAWWKQGGNAYGATGTLGATDLQALKIITNGVTRDSTAAAGQTYIMGDSSATETSLIVSNSRGTGGAIVPQTNKLFFGTGKGGNYALNTPYMAFGAAESAANPTLSTNGISGFSTFDLYNTSISAAIIEGATAITGGNMFSLTSRMYSAGGGITNTSGTLNLLGLLTDNGNLNFAPVSGTANFNTISDQRVINQTGTASGITSTLTNSQITIAAAADYRFLYAANDSGASFYSKGTAPMKHMGKVIIGTTANNGTDALQVSGSLNLTAPGNKIKIATGINASVDTVSLSGGTVTVNTTAVTTASLIFVQYNGPVYTTSSVLVVSSVTPGISFVIKAVTAGGTGINPADNNNVKYWIIN